MKTWLMVALGFSINAMSGYPLPGDTYECYGDNTFLRFHQGETSAVRTLFFSHENTSWNLSGRKEIQVGMGIEDPGFIITASPSNATAMVFVHIPGRHSEFNTQIEYKPKGNQGWTKQIPITCHK